MNNVLTYYDTLKHAYETDQFYLSRNTDTAHNTMIMRLMLKKSNKIYTYCGNMSVFRQSFYDSLHAANLHGEEIKQFMIEVLTDFLKRKNTSI